MKLQFEPGAGDTHSSLFIQGVIVHDIHKVLDKHFCWVKIKKKKWNLDGVTNLNANRQHLRRPLNCITRPPASFVGSAYVTNPMPAVSTCATLRWLVFAVFPLWELFYFSISKPSSPFKAWFKDRFLEGLGLSGWAQSSPDFLENKPSSAREPTFWPGLLWKF